MGRTNANTKLNRLSYSDPLCREKRLPPESVVPLTSEDIKRYRARSRRCTLNVGGEHHEVLWETLERIPNSRLGRLSQSTNPMEIYCLCDEYVPEKNEFYFDRPARSFSAVLGLYRTGHLHIVDDVCVIALKDDLTYWGISEHLMDACCLHRYYQRKEQMEEEIKKTNEICLQQAQEDQFGSGKLANLRRKIWDLVEKPQTSMAARVSY
ncbi:unnamed protein product [Echinostoma caproni]|uniref:BTB domain-containing protein n=1 Tax=Echinostoma caproni TaxID=27848 RepID=A0A183A976_9TREM|nr:unnamed protein product [Echinostoma caproni]